MSDINELGFKKLTKENWQIPDEFNKYFIRLNFETGEKTEITANDRADLFLQYELSEFVPVDVRKQFETARGAMLYGFYFYPLFALGSEQLFRVAESAISHKCILLGLKIKSLKYQVKLKKLNSLNEINDAELKEWDSLREMRNILSHSTIQTLHPHWDSVFYLKLISEKINDLFLPKTK